MKKGNLFRNLPDALDEEHLLEIASNSCLRIERIVSRGQASPPGFWYDQPTTEWVAVLQGEARLEFDDELPAISMRPGDYIEIPAHRKHRVAWTTPNEPTVWLAIHWPEESP